MGDAVVIKQYSFTSSTLNSNLFRVPSMHYFRTDTSNPPAARTPSNCSSSLPNNFWTQVCMSSLNCLDHSIHSVTFCTYFWDTVQRPCLWHCAPKTPVVKIKFSLTNAIFSILCISLSSTYIYCKYISSALKDIHVTGITRHRVNIYFFWYVLQYSSYRKMVSVTFSDIIQILNI
jgi:hypothetical protein